MYAINTDGFYMTNPKYDYHIKSDVKFTTDCIDKPFITKSTPQYFDKHYCENLEFDSYTDKVSTMGKLIYGAAGCGKTYKLCDMI